MPKGLPKSYIKKWGISKLAWRKFRAGALTRGIRTRTKAIKRRIRRSNPKKGKTKTKKRRVVRTARKKRRGGKSMTRTAFKLVRLGALAAPAFARAMESGTPEHKVQMAVADYTGFQIWNKTFAWENLIRGWGPYVGAILTTYGIPKISAIIRKL